MQNVKAIVKKNILNKIIDKKTQIARDGGGGNLGLYELWSNTVGGSKAGGFGHPTIHVKSMVV